MGLVLPFVETLKEGSLVLEFDIVVIAETLVALDHVATLGSNLIQNNRAPNIALLNTVKTFVACSNEHINVVNVANLVVLTPVVGQMEFSLLRVCVLAISLPSDDKGHVATVLAE
jgi:hypothetical protein